MNELLKFSRKPEIKLDRAHNSINGSDAESVGASLIVRSTRGEIRWGSREEDNRKIDLILSADHPWIEGDRLNIKLQIKSGEANGSRHEGGFRLNSSVVKDLKKIGSTSCAIWVDRNDGACFWAFIHPNTSDGSHDYGAMHKISPATIYDLARCDTRFKPGFEADGKKVTISCTAQTIGKLRSKAKKSYKEIGPILNPVLGPVEVTRTGWNHMFRSSRKISGKESSLRVIPHLNHILSNIPSEHFIPEYKIEKYDGMETRSSIHILKYSGVKKYESSTGTSSVEVIVKVQEDIRYPVLWRDTALLSQQIERRVVLISTYYKSA